METGPIYGVELLGTLPLDGGMRQALPNRSDLNAVRQVSERTVAGYEVLLEHYRRVVAERDRLREKLTVATSGLVKAESDAARKEAKEHVVVCRENPLVNVLDGVLPTLQVQSLQRDTDKYPLSEHEKAVIARSLRHSRDSLRRRFPSTPPDLPKPASM